MWIIILSIVIIFLVVILYLNYYIKFLNKDELYNELEQDNDNYLKNLNTANLTLRNVKSIDDYLIILENSCYTLSSLEKLKIYYNYWKIKNKIDNIQCIGIDNNKLKNLKFKVGCFTGKEYEFGFPHTRSDIIVLNYNNLYDNNLDKTILHELIHIYQKKYPEDIQAYLNFYNFTKISAFKNNNRMNPDITNEIYKNNDLTYQCNISYNNKISCTNNDSKFEHPYEYMAYTISENI